MSRSNGYILTESLLEDGSNRLSFVADWNGVYMLSVRNFSGFSIWGLTVDDFVARIESQYGINKLRLSRWPNED